MPLDTRGGRREEWGRRREAFQYETDQLIVDLYNQDVTLDSWLGRFKQSIKDHHITQAVIGNDGDWDGMTQRYWGKTGNILRQQYYFATEFAKDILDRARAGDMPSEAALRARMNLYEGIGTGGGYWVELQSHGDGDDMMIWTLSPAEHCSTCRSRDGLVQQRSDITFVPKDGSTECLGNCLCSWEVQSGG